ncbi:MAG: CopG family antitoxin [bacterium]
MSKQDERITIRISSEDLNKIKKSAAENGLRYQTFIKSIIHQYIQR